MKKTNIILTATIAAATALTAFSAEEPKNGGETMKISGEVVDMACYVDHGAAGDKHADCAKKCITNGLPVGLKADDGKTYLLIGEHKPINADLAQYAAKTITVKGKVASRDGINMIENAEIQK